MIKNYKHIIWDWNGTILNDVDLCVELINELLKEHNLKKGGSYTRTRTPVKLVYREPQHDYSLVLKREAQIKRWTKSKKLALINGNFSELSRLSVSHDP